MTSIELAGMPARAVLLQPELVVRCSSQPGGLPTGGTGIAGLPG